MGKIIFPYVEKLKKDQEKYEWSTKSLDNVDAHVGVLKGTLLKTAAKRKVAGIITDET